MDVYTTEQRFDQKTGQSSHTVKVWKETRCDFSGRVVASSEDEGLKAYYVKFVVDYGDEDSCHGACGDEFEFGRAHEIDVYAFMQQPYVIYDDAGNRSDTGESEMQAFFAELPKYGSLEHALREMRIKTAERLIQERIVKAEDLTEE